MGKHDNLSKALAIAGTILLAFPILAPLLMGLGSISGRGGFRIDYLMPFEIYPVALIGAALLLWASLRAHARRGMVGICIAVMLGGVLLGGVAAQLTGIANSVEQLEAWRYAVVIAFGAVSLAGQVALVVTGSLIMRELFAHGTGATPPIAPAAGA